MMKVITAYADKDNRVEFFSNGTGAALIDGKFYPIPKEDFDFFAGLSRDFEHFSGRDIAAYYDVFGGLGGTERRENGSV